MIVLPVLDKRENLLQMMDKLNEEVEELEEAVLNYKAYGNKKIDNLIEETFDVMQVVVGILDKLQNEENVQLDKSSQEHLLKIINRGWLIKRVLNIKE